jgi:peptidoglycan-N-acetylglucosamine deacetylase
MFYTVKTPWWLKRLYPGCIWEMPSGENKIYLTFDDGPHPEVTPFVLDCLAKYQMKATFFCIGKNVRLYPELFKRIIDEGHRVGNHTENHLNGWKSSDREYFEDVITANGVIPSALFRPPYGRATWFQLNCLRTSSAKLKIVMWTVLSGDFDPGLSPDQCFLNVRQNLQPGNIIVFHDSKKAEEKLRYALPLVIEEIQSKRLVADKIRY